MDKSLESVIQQSKSVAILLPQKPFFDQVAAGLALYLSLSAGNKDVVISSPTQMTVEFNRLVGVDKIKGDIASKNLVIKFANYDGKNVERVSADIEGGLFQLTIIPKPGSNAPQKGQIDMTYSGLGNDTVVMIGGVSESNFPILASGDLNQAQLVHIGTRPLATSSGKNVVSFIQDASSVSEALASMIFANRKNAVMPTSPNQSSGKDTFVVNPDVATNLLMGIEAATNSFSSASVVADTFYMASELMRAGGRRGQSQSTPQAYPPGAIPQVPTAVQSQTPSNTSQMPQQVTGGQSNTSGHTPNQQKQSASQTTPRDWLNKPKIYKGTQTSQR